MKSISGIYKIMNNVNGDFYIGSSVDLNRRISSHKYELKKGVHSNEHLQRAWNKYGFDSFEFIVIELCEREETLKREQYYLDTLSPKYNIAKSVSAPMLGRKVTDNAKEKIIKSLTGRVCSPETREKISKAQKGVSRKPHTEEFKEKMSLLFKGRKISQEQKEWLSEYRKGKSFMGDDAKKRLSERMKGVKTCLGYKHTDEAKKNMSEAHKGRKHPQSQKEKISESLRLAWKRRKEINDGRIKEDCLEE